MLLASRLNGPNDSDFGGLPAPDMAFSIRTSGLSSGCLETTNTLDTDAKTLAAPHALGASCPDHGHPSDGPLRRFIREIHCRSLWQVPGIYAVGSWAVLQVVDTLGGALNLPDWFPSFALALLIVGLPVVLATAFVQEGGPGDERQDVDMMRQRVLN